MDDGEDACGRDCAGHERIAICIGLLIHPSHAEDDPHDLKDGDGESKETPRIVHEDIKESLTRPI